MSLTRAHSMWRTPFHRQPHSSAARLQITIAAMALVAWLPSVHAQELLSARPFGAGEALAYHVSFGLLGSGSGSLRVGRSAPLRDEPVVQLSFDFDGNVGPFPVSNHSRSWLSTRRWASLRYEVEEHSPLQSIREAVEI